MKYAVIFAKRLHGFSGKVLYINLIAMVLVGLLDGIGIFLLLPFINASGFANINTKFASFFQWFSYIPTGWTLPAVLLIYATVVILQTFVQQRLNVRNMKILIQFTNHVRLEIYRGLLQSNWSFFAKKRKSDLVNVLMSEFDRFVSGISLFSQMMTTTIFVCIQVGIAVWLSVKITIFVLVVGVILSFFSLTFIRRSQSLGRKALDTSQQYSRGITDGFNGIKDIKSNGLEGARYEWLENWCETIEDEKLAESRLRNNSQLFYKSASTILIVLLLYISVTLFQSQPAQLLLIVLIFSRLWPHFINIQSNLQEIGRTLPVFHSFICLQDDCEREREMNQFSKHTTDVLRMEKGISCENISFRYYGKEDDSLRNITVHIAVNETTAIVGRSGAGKSTFIDIVMGLMMPREGVVCIDDNPVTLETLPLLRQSISYVSQDPFLFNETIRQNLLLVNEKATEEELWEALHFAAADFVEELPHGLDTVVGDRGVRLSGGERQRLVLARAILRNPSILVLDEATSALDSENERKIHDALDRLKGKMTIIVIAHRLSTIRNADQVIVIDKGEVVQQGEFTELSEHKTGLFHHLLTNQIVVEV